MPGCDVANRDAPEKRHKVFDATSHAGPHCFPSRVPGCIEPSAGNILETRVGVLGEREITDLLAEFGQATLREFAIFRFEGTAKLLASSFQQPIIFSRRFEPVEIFTDFVEDQSGRFPGVIYHRVTELGDKSNDSYCFQSTENKVVMPE